MTVVVYPNEAAPALSIPTVNGETFTLVKRNPEKLTVVIFYRGLHCPLCKNHVKEVADNYQKALDAGIEIIVVSMDTEEKALQFSKDVAAMLESADGNTTLTVPIGYGLTEEQAREWGLYISSAREGTNEPDVYSEPGLFVIRPDATVFSAMVQSAPFTRPSIPQLLSTLQYVLDNNYPARGNLTKKSI
jgi:peroxiredoxin